ncbi:MAG: phosphate ABC transporter permease subunit PstC [Devosia sp.]|nr:phosphate ABC transporter permease subunit PstC [Devosia sp.]
MAGYLFLAIVVLATAAYFVGTMSGRRLVPAGGEKVHSLPGYHGLLGAFAVFIPAAIVLLLWLAFQSRIVDIFLVNSLPSTLIEGLGTGQMSLLLSEIRNVAAGVVFSEPVPDVVAAAERLKSFREVSEWIIAALVAVLMLGGFLWVRSQIAVRFRARNAVERVLSGVMVACAGLAILITLAIFFSLLYEAIRFFSVVPPLEFFFGLRWEPQIAIRADQVAGAGAFGAIPVFVGTFLVAAVAMAVATPIGLFTAIYLVEYSSDRFRSVIKPTLEILAGVPTVVYGFFAVLTVAPAIREAGGLIGIVMSPNSALAAGLVMGIMLIPIIASLSDDALRAVPRTMRDGSLAMGATPGETVMKVLVPAAIPGIMGGVLLSTSIAIGETMIVAMAAGLIASLTINPLDSVTTVTVQIITLLTGDTEFDSPKTLAAFGLGLVLFLMTLILNVIALTIVKRFREQYD